MSVSTWKLEEF